MTRAGLRHVVLAPLLTWGALLALLILTCGYALWPDAPAKPVTGVSIAIAKALLIAIFFMQLRRAEGLVRLAALAGLIWASFLFLFAFADYLTR